jgi:hypothetical protein
MSRHNQHNHQHQMSFAEIGTLYNQISNELQGGVTPRNQDLLINQVLTVQTQLQGLIDSGALNNLDGISLVHAQNIADQMNFLKSEIANFGANTADPKFINDVVRDVQDIVAGDAGLSALAHQGNHSGFQQVSFLLTDPTPFPDTPFQTQTLLKFIDDSNSLAARAVALEGADPISRPSPPTPTPIRRHRAESSRRASTTSSTSTAFRGRLRAN